MEVANSTETATLRHIEDLKTLKERLLLEHIHVELQLHQQMAPRQLASVRSQSVPLTAHLAAKIGTYYKLSQWVSGQPVFLESLQQTNKTLYYRHALLTNIRESGQTGKS